MTNVSSQQLKDVKNLIRKECKVLKVKHTLKALHSFKGVEIAVTFFDRSPNEFEQLTSFVKAYQLNYPNSHIKLGTPQVNQVLTLNHFSKELKQIAWTFLRQHVAHTKRLTPIYDELNPYSKFLGCYTYHTVFKLMNNELDLSALFWLEQRRIK